MRRPIEFAQGGNHCHFHVKHQQFLHLIGRNPTIWSDDKVGRSLIDIHQ